LEFTPILAALFSIIRARARMNSKLPCPDLSWPTSVLAARKYNMTNTRIAAVKDVFGFLRKLTNVQISCDEHFSRLETSVSAFHISGSKRTDVRRP